MAKLKESKHEDCELVIIERLHKDKLHPTPGLYCEPHGCLIKWLSKPDFCSLIEFGVTNLGMLKDEQVVYERRLKLMRQKSSIS
jgi:hypothetical protein